MAGRSGAFVGGLLGLAAGVAVGTVLSSGTRRDSTRGKVLVGAMMLSAVTGAVIGAGCPDCPPCPGIKTAPTTPPDCPVGYYWNPTLQKCVVQLT